MRTEISASIGLSYERATRGYPNGRAGEGALVRRGSCIPRWFRSESGLVDPSKGSYTALFYIWATGPLDDPDPLSSIQFPRAVTSTLLSQTQKVRGDNRWVLKAYRCEMLNEWDLHSYPFDDHNLSLVFRLSPTDEKKFVIDLDTTNSGIAQKRIEGGWQIEDFKLFTYRVLSVHG
jgi:hypothetical protein